MNPHGNPQNLTNAGKGRPRGVPNKFSKATKEQFMTAFEQSGGLPALVKWKKSPANRLEFYKMLVRLLPRTVEASLEHEWNIEGLDFGEDSTPEEIVAKCQEYTDRMREN